MPTNSELIADVEARASIETLREVVETLAPLDRLAGTEGERVAAEWLAQRLERAGRRGERRRGGVPGRVRTTARRRSPRPESLPGSPAPAGRARGAATAAGAAAAGLLADDVSNGLRPVRTRPGAAQDDLERGRRARRPGRRADHRR